MDRYRAYGPSDDPSLTEGDDGFVGVNQYDAPENLPPGQVQDAVNMDFGSQDAVTRGGFVALPSTSMAPLAMTWTSRTSAANRDWYSVAYGNGVYVAVAEDGAATNLVQTSVDGLSWTSQTAASAGSWHSVAFGNGLFVAVDRSTGTGTNSFMSSPDGETWTIRTAPTTSISWNGVTFGNGRFVAVGQSAVAYSVDGVNWVAGTIGAQTWNSVTYGNGYFVAVASSGTGNRAAYSTNGATWTSGTSAADNFWSSVTYGANKFVAVSVAGASRVMYSTDNGASWTSASAAEANAWQSVVFGNGLFVAVSSDGTNRTMASRDAVTWSASAAGAANQWFGVTFANGLFVAVSNSGVGNRVMTSGVSARVFASASYSDPNVAASQWIMLAGPTSVGFHAFGEQSRTVNYASGQTVSQQATIVQCNNQVYIWRGVDETPLVWSGVWGTNFELAGGSIPNSNQATYAQNRQWAIVGKDSLYASDVLDFTAFTEITNQFNLNTGDSNYLVTTFPFGDTTLIVFKNRSILALQGVDGSLTDVVATEVTRQVGAVGINSVVSVGPDLVYVSDRNINLLSLTTTNNAVQHKTLPLSQNIRRTFDRVNWQAASKISMGYWDNKLYVALPLDNSTVCNTVVVHNFITGQWYGEWSFAEAMGMQIQGWASATYAGLQRLHCISEDGRIFVVGEGQNDISGTTVAEIETSLTTRAYRFNNNNQIPRRMYADLSTNRPSFSITAYADGASEYSEITTDQTFSRSQSWKFHDSTYDMDNSNDDYNRAYRKDYATGPNSVECGSGFLPEMTQNYRYPVLTRRKGRLSWIKITNTTGYIEINGVGVESRAGDRNSLVQVM